MTVTDGRNAIRILVDTAHVFAASAYTIRQRLKILKILERKLPKTLGTIILSYIINCSNFLRYFVKSPPARDPDRWHLLKIVCYTSENAK